MLILNKLSPNPRALDMILDKLREAFPEFDWMQDPTLVQLSIERLQERVVAPLGGRFELTVWGPKIPRGPCYHAFLRLVENDKLLVHAPSCLSPVKAMEAMQLRIAVMGEAVDTFETWSSFRPLMDELRERTRPHRGDPNV